MLDYLRRVLENADRNGCVAFFFTGFGVGVTIFLALYVIATF